MTNVKNNVMDRRDFLARLGVGTAVAITAPKILLPKEKIYDPEITIPGFGLERNIDGYLDGSYLTWKDKPIMKLADCRINFEYPQMDVTQNDDSYPKYLQGRPVIDVKMTGWANAKLLEALDSCELVSLYIKNKKENTAYTCDGYITEMITLPHSLVEVRLKMSGALMRHSIGGPLRGKHAHTMIVDDWKGKKI